MIQSIFGQCAYSQSTSATDYVGLTPLTGSATPAANEQIISAPGTLRNFRLAISAVAGVGKSWTFTLQKNNVDTAVVITISGGTDTSGTDTTNTVTVAAGDLVKWKSVPSGTPAGALNQFSCEFMSLDDYTSIFTMGVMSFTSVTPYYLAVFSGDNNSTAAANRTSVVPCAGVITGYRAYRQGTAAAGGSFDLAIYKNGVKQDGSGGTVDTRVSLSGTGTTNTATASFSLSVAAGDTIYMQSDRNGAPNSSAVSICTTFQATTPNTFPVVLFTASLSTSTGNQFTPVVAFEGIGLSASELLTTLLASIEIVAMYVNLSAAPGATKSRTITLRKNGGDASSTCTISDPATTGNDTTHKVKYKAGDTIALREAAAASSTTAALMSVGFAVKNDQSKGAGAGNSGSKKGGGGGISVQNPGGASYLSIWKPRH